ncbi:transporter substrate-binding domain-containing protein [Desulfohalobiaceae bacterium Ax17]|uniref:transporter substrate-binding domain-containing protein n=1 Tax=Desulfovulcanus ferrireducens TaxID=2831190 RepID=UPI00207BA709|nr:transporter substrate-binding domain-containing protein [Desulfovulcanus ferrireducens]MBT8763501.1 transporter substrate-binding domain-containing protein [Desulfovulcanus ferrireducens]
MQFLKLSFAMLTMFMMTFLIFLGGHAGAADLDEIKKRGVLKHLGVPYANFVTGMGDGLDAELVQLFAKDLGLAYQYVKTSWEMVIPDLIGKKVKAKGNDVEMLDQTPIRGDIAANGLTMLPWREKIVLFSDPIFPTQVWLIVRSDSDISPITPTGDIAKDIAAVKAKLQGRTVLGKSGTCLDGSLYKLEQAGAKFIHFPGQLNDLAYAVIKGEAEAALLDVPDALIALENWAGQIKVVGPISPPQKMATAFPKNAPKLRQAYNQFLDKCKKDGTYIRLVKKYYPVVFEYYPEFFNDVIQANK